MINCRILIPILFLIFIESSDCYGQNHIKSDREKMNLFGKVKCLTKNRYEVIVEDGIVKKGDVFSFIGVNITSNEKFTFNEEGNIIGLIRYKIDGNPYHKRIQNYDENGNLVRIEVVGIHPYTQDIKYNSKGDTIEKYSDNKTMSDIKKVFYYNQLGNLVETNTLLLSDSTEHIISLDTFNKKGKVIERVGMEEDGKMFGKELYEYDDDGNVLIYNGYDYSNENLIVKKVYEYYDNGVRKEMKYFSKEMYKNDRYKSGKHFFLYRFEHYNPKGKRIESVGYDMDGNIEYKYKSDYDKFGNEIEKNRIDNENEVYKTYYFKYDFDSESNWIEKITYWDKVPKFIVERKIEYYE